MKPSGREEVPLTSPPGTPAGSTTSSSRGRLYRTMGESRFTTREIAALDFLLGIPMEKESSIVQAGYLQQQERYGVVPSEISYGEEQKQEEEEEEKHQQELDPPTPTTSIKWWDKLIKGGDVTRHKRDEFSDLEQPDLQEDQQVSLHSTTQTTTHAALSTKIVPLHSAPGRRLDGRDAVMVQIPTSLGSAINTRHKTIARQAAVREWEVRVAHGLDENPALLDGRAFFSNKGSYPMGVFSVLKYEPKKEEAALRRQKLEALGGGGTQFIVPQRDWRGISYRALLPRVEKKNSAFNRHLRRNRKKLAIESESGLEDDKDDESETDDEDDYSSSSAESDAYVPGFLDDPEMRQGRHRHVMNGDQVTGCIMASTVQFVKPQDLKADLNKQFRERFDGWEPPKSQRKWIGAKVVDGVYTPMDPTETTESEDRFSENEKPTPVRRRERQISITSSMDSSMGENTTTKETIRMPPSLTLSKIRSIKDQALLAVVKADLEISTAALACVYFERLCLDCRVDKSNRRLSFAACLLLAAKINESNIALVMQEGGSDTTTDKIGKLTTLIRPTKGSSTMFESLLEFFTHDWSLSLKNLFAAEWGVFAALGFSLHATPSQVAFHFKRFMKVLSWGQVAYLGDTQYNSWQDCLLEEDLRREERNKRRERRQERKERKLMELQRELHRHQDDSKTRRVDEELHEKEHSVTTSSRDAVASSTSASLPLKQERQKKGAALKILNRFSLKRQHPSLPQGMDKLDPSFLSDHGSPGVSQGRGMVRSPSMPTVKNSYDDSGDEPPHHDMSSSDVSGDLLHDGGGINL